MSNIKYEELGLRLKAILSKYKDIDLVDVSKNMTSMLPDFLKKRTGKEYSQVNPIDISWVIDPRFHHDPEFLKALANSLPISEEERDWLLRGSSSQSYKMASFNGCEEITEEHQKQTNEHVDELFNHYNG